MPLTPSTTDKFTKVGNPGSATTMSAPGYTAGGSSMNVGSTTNWPPDTKVIFAVDRAQVINGVETRIAGTYSEFEGIVTGANTIASVQLRFGNAQNYPAGSLTRVYIPVSSTRENDLVEGFAVEHGLNGVHSDGFIVPRYFSAALKSGWFTVSDTWTFASFDTPTKTGVVNVPNDATLTYSPGMRLKFSNNGSTQYGIIVAVTATTLTIYFGTDYSLTNSAISTVFYSVYKAPFGFPLYREKWTILVASAAQCSKASPAINTWYGDTALSATGPSILVPVGAWTLSYQAAYQMGPLTSTNLTGLMSLSTSASAESDPDFTSFIRTVGSNVAREADQTCFREKDITTTAATKYYLVIDTSNGSVGSISIRGDQSKTILRAVCAYL